MADQFPVGLWSIALGLDPDDAAGLVVKLGKDTMSVDEAAKFFPVTEDEKIAIQATLRNASMTQLYNLSPLGAPSQPGLSGLGGILDSVRNVFSSIGSAVRGVVRTVGAAIKTIAPTVTALAPALVTMIPGVGAVAGPLLGSALAARGQVVAARQQVHASETAVTVAAEQAASDQAYYAQQAQGGGGGTAASFFEKSWYQRPEILIPVGAAGVMLLVTVVSAMRN